MGDATVALVSCMVPNPAGTTAQVEDGQIWSNFVEALPLDGRDSTGQLAQVPAQAAGRFGLSPGRVTQLRQQWRGQWLAFVGEDQDAGRSLRSAPA